jgi:Flp pilus assembly protein TadD
MWRRHSIEVVLVVLLSGCSSMPWYKPMPSADQSAAGTAVPAPASAGTATAGSAKAAAGGSATSVGAGGPCTPSATGAAGPAGAKVGAAGSAGAKPTAVVGTVPCGPAGPPSAKATADFNRAVNFMRSGNNTEAELEFKQMTLAYPRLATPYVNLGILYRKTGHLDQSEEALKGAVERNGGSAVAWNELGATQRMRGEFPAAAASYEKAITAEPNFAPAYRNLGVVSDLYLGDPERALTALERYKELTGEDRPVTSWIAELRQRTGKPPVKPAGAAPAAPTGDASPAPPTKPAPKAGG